MHLVTIIVKKKNYNPLYRSFRKIFEDGKWTKYRDLERTKWWWSLSKLQSRARLSKWKLGYDYARI